MSGRTGTPGGIFGGGIAAFRVLVAEADLEPSQVQDIGDIIPKLLEIKSKDNTPIRFNLRIEIGDGKTAPSPEVIQKVNVLLKSIKDDMELRG